MLIHVIDPDVGRRAKLSRAILDLDCHAEIYEDRDEFDRLRPRQGLIFAAYCEATYLLESVDDGDMVLPVIAYAEQPEASEIVETIQAGAIDFFEWPTNRERLSHVLCNAERAQSEQQGMLRKRGAARKLVSSLTPRELEVLMGITAGGSNKSIATDLGISPRTVEIHRGHMMRKLKAEAIGNAVRIAIYAGLDVESQLAA